MKIQRVCDVNNKSKIIPVYSKNFMNFCVLNNANHFTNFVIDILIPGQAGLELSAGLTPTIKIKLDRLHNWTYCLQISGLCCTVLAVYGRLCTCNYNILII